VKTVINGDDFVTQGHSYSLGLIMIVSDGNVNYNKTPKWDDCWDCITCLVMTSNWRSGNVFSVHCLISHLVCCIPVK